MLSGSFFYSRGLFLPEMASAFEVGRFEVSMAYTVAGISSAMAAPAIGLMLDRFPARLVLLVGGLVLGVGYIAAAASPNIWHLYLWIGVLAGLGWITVSNFGSAKVIVAWFKERLGVALAIDAMGASLAGVIIAPIGTLLISTLGWRGAYAMLGVVTGLLATLIVLTLIREPPKAESAELDAHGSLRRNAPLQVSSLDALRRLEFWAYVAIFGLMGGVWNGINLHLFGHLRHLGLADLQAASVLSIEAASAALGKPVIGLLSDRIGAAPASGLILGLQLAGVILFMQGGTYEAAMAAAVVYGLGLSGLVVLQGAMVAEVFGRKSFGAISGSARLAMLPIILAASPLAGFIYDRQQSYDSAFWAFAAALGLALVASVALHLWMRQKPTLALEE